MGPGQLTWPLAEAVRRKIHASSRLPSLFVDPSLAADRSLTALLPGIVHADVSDRLVSSSDLWSVPSTAAAVLGIFIFMGGLGLGSTILGQRAESARSIFVLTKPPTAYRGLRRGASICIPAPSFN